MRTGSDSLPEPRRGGELTRRMRALDRERGRMPPSIERQVPERQLPAPGGPGFVGRGDNVFDPRRLSIIETPKSPLSFWVNVAICTLLVVALAWAYFGKIASNTNAMGKIQTAGRTKVLETIAPGQVIKINVHDGDSVKEGETLVELDPTDAMAARTILDQKLTDLRAETLRLETDIQAARAETIDPKAKIPWGDKVPDIVRRREEGVSLAELGNLAAQITTLTSQKHAREVERDKFTNNITAQKALLAVTKENLDMVESLTKSGYNSQAKFLDMKAKLDDQQVALTSFEGSLENAKQAILSIESQIAKARETFVMTSTQTVSTNEQSIIDLEQKLVKAEQTLNNMTLRAPVSGVVHASAVTTIGQVVQPRQQLMQIVPRDAPLEIQTYISNLDIGFIRKGDPAVIKVTTFRYGTYGAIDGKVVDIANDALNTQGKATVLNGSTDGEDRSMSAAQKTGRIEFPVLVRADRSTMMIDGREVPLVPGMQVTVEILTEKRRAIDYVISPIEELLSSALHEK